MTAAETRLRDGRYAIVGVLGEGAQGTTLDGVDLRAGRPVAVKRFDVRGAKSWKEVELAEREARVLSSLDHPLLPRYVEHFEEDGALYLVMEKIEGETLAARGRLDEREVMDFLASAADVLGYLHRRAQPLVHRDIKPRNVVRRPDGSFAFVDFGAVAERLRPHGGSTIVGTMGYMAPEQFQGRALPVSDVYAVGATALAMLTGQEPETLPHRGLSVDVRAALGGRVSDRLVQALQAMLEPDPDRRAADLGAVVARLRSDRDQTRAPRGDAQGDGHRERPRERKRQKRAAHHAARRAAREARRGAPRAAGGGLVPLMWTAWGLGWWLVQPRTSTGFMFVWLALTILVSSVLRTRARAGAALPDPRSGERVRVAPVGPRVDAALPPRVDSHAAHAEEEAAAEAERAEEEAAERAAAEEAARARRARRS